MSYIYIYLDTKSTGKGNFFPKPNAKDKDIYMLYRNDIATHANVIRGLSVIYHIKTIAVNANCGYFMAIIFWIFRGYFRTEKGYEKLFDTYSHSDNLITDQPPQSQSPSNQQFANQPLLNPQQPAQSPFANQSPLNPQPQSLQNPLSSQPPFNPQTQTQMQTLPFSSNQQSQPFSTSCIPLHSLPQFSNIPSFPFISFRELPQIKQNPYPSGPFGSQ
ncbi:MAG: hypothetical protein LBI69_01410 [Puniceicoccales bacterium]|jgi:hypothetical protein|nr:hypothetical protein [Puniceicoccales bacterium]